MISFRETSFIVQHESPKSASSHMCLPVMSSKQTTRNLLFGEALWLLPKSLGEAVTAGQKASSFIIRRENIHRQTRSRFPWPNHVFLARAFVSSENKDLDHDLESNHLFQTIDLTSPNDFLMCCMSTDWLFNLCPARSVHPTLTPRWHREHCQYACTSPTQLKCSRFCAYSTG